MWLSKISHPASLKANVWRFIKAGQQRPERPQAPRAGPRRAGAGRQKHTAAAPFTAAPTSTDATSPPPRDGPQPLSQPALGAWGQHGQQRGASQPPEECAGRSACGPSQDQDRWSMIAPAVLERAHSPCTLTAHTHPRGLRATPRRGDCDETGVCARTSRNRKPGRPPKRKDPSLKVQVRPLHRPV